MEGESAAITKKINEKVRLLHAAKENNIQNNIQKKQLAIEVEQIRIENVKVTCYKLNSIRWLGRLYYQIQSHARNKQRKNLLPRKNRWTDWKRNGG